MPATRSEKPSTPEGNGREPRRVLLLVSHDFGELGLAWQFVEGSGFANASLLLLPPHLYGPNKDHLPCAGQSYRNLEEAESAIAAFNPDLIVLCSGHLLVPNGIASCRKLDALLSRVQKSGCAVVTTDPFLGFTSTIRISDISREMVWQRPSTGLFVKLAGSLLVPLFRFRAWRRFRRSSRILADVPTLSPVPDPTGEKRWHGFRPARMPIRQHRDSPDPYWIFILSELDYQWQCHLLGKDNVVDQLGSLAMETLDRNKKPLMLLPGSCKAALQPVLPKRASEALIANVSYPEFVELLRRAEHAFYWNMVSHSLLLRIREELPVHFLSRGHTAFMFPELHQRAITAYYLGQEPEILDAAELPDLTSLQTSARQFNSIMKKQVSEMGNLPCPDKLVSIFYRQCFKPGDKEA